MDPEQRRVVFWMSRFLSWLFGGLGLAIAFTAIPREWTHDAYLPRPYTLSGLELDERVFWLTVCGGSAFYFHTIARGFSSGTLDHFPVPRLPWEPKP